MEAGPAGGDSPSLRARLSDGPDRCVVAPRPLRASPTAAERGLRGTRAPGNAALKDEVFELQASLEESHWWFLGRRSILHSLLAAILPPHSGGTVIDIGCGTGGNIASLAEGYRCVGLEPAPAALALARRRYPSVQFVAGGDPALVAEFVTPGTVILLTDVLEHVVDDFLLFSQVLAIMPPGSHVLLTVPANPALWSPHDVALAHYRRYDIARLRLVWHQLPVREHLVTPFNARLYPLVRLRRALAALSGTSSGSRGTDLSLPPFNARLYPLVRPRRALAGRRARGAGWGAPVLSPPPFTPRLYPLVRLRRALAALSGTSSGSR